MTATVLQVYSRKVLSNHLISLTIPHSPVGCQQHGCNMNGAILPVLFRRAMFHRGFMRNNRSRGPRPRPILQERYQQVCVVAVLHVGTDAPIVEIGGIRLTSAHKNVA